MSRGSSASSRSELWVGKPWILPGVLARTISIIVVTVVILWAESYFGVASASFAGLGIMLWTGLLLFLVWIISLIHLLLLRASNTYVLRNDSLEIRTGIVTSRSLVISPSGFSDLEVIRSLSARIIGSGDIIIRTQSETDSEKKMVRVRNPSEAADKIRGIMARPIVRIESPEPSDEKKQ